jgi:hypothetical protein
MQWRSIDAVPAWWRRSGTALLTRRPRHARASFWASARLIRAFHLGHLRPRDTNGRAGPSGLGRLGGQADTRTVARVRVSVWVARCAQRVDASHNQGNRKTFEKCEFK